ncbi:helix-hairpin-helix domain-containing protein [Pontibacillus chungwhensis]|uniref:Helix-hairpin-helix domain-containing protein n=2 Tax=Pontibacillus TaxID=289201 RepID=A0ABY8UUA2_9BACI|nr:helix-hairpin-helix domain-containing protein [Pontibacillus chungwhensis]WIF97008.1 helix-hairpin-helix domain-containing protein [Pontibacillus chungwhensis]
MREGRSFMIRIYKYFLSIAVLVAFVLWMLWPQEPPTDEVPILQKDKEESINLNQPQQETSLMYVDVKGEVHSPGVYQMKEGSRVEDAIDRAGGLTVQGDPLSVNLALRVQDEMVVIVLEKGEGRLSDERLSDKVFVNQASLEELKTLSGVGEAKAKAILEYRETNGPFQNADQLLDVSGIGQKTLEGFIEDIQLP